MSHLDLPRLNFAGMFQADVSTINNTVTNYDNATFTAAKQEPGADGGWNPEGTGTFRLVDCKVTGGRLGKRLLATSQDDPAIGLALDNASLRVSGKLVDLDPQQQMVSQIWGMQVRLADSAGIGLFAGDYEPAAFINLWQRQLNVTAPNDQQLAAVYQSVLRNVAWQVNTGSPLLDALREASDDGWLAINLNVYGYGRDPGIDRYTLGHAVGSIGPWRKGQPKHFVVGRQMIPVFPADDPTSPVNGVAWFTAVVNEAEGVVSADFGNCLPIDGANGGFHDLGPLLLAVNVSNDCSQATPLATVLPASVQILGQVGYQPGSQAAQNAWYAQTAGIEDFACDAATAAKLDSQPLLLLSPQTAAGGNVAAYKVLVQESIGGLYARADNFVCRLNPGETGTVDIYASRFGQPVATDLVVGTQLGMMTAFQPPAINTGSLLYPQQLATNDAGIAQLAIQSPETGPGNPRGYIDGQLYGIGLTLPAQPAGSPANFWNFVSVLAYDLTPVPAQPTWYADIQPTFQQYANLYPIMSRHLIDLGNYDAVVPHVRILDLAFSLPAADPNHMPVTRDLSDAKRATILKWLRQPGPDGLPLKGTPPPPKNVAPHMPSSPPMNLDPLQAAGKTTVALAFRARLAAQRGQP